MKKLIRIFILVIFIFSFKISFANTAENINTYGPYDELESIELTNEGLFYIYETDDKVYYQVGDQNFAADGYCLPNADGCYPTSQLKTSDNNSMFIDIKGKLFDEVDKNWGCTVKTKNKEYGPYSYVYPNFQITDNNIGFVYFEKTNDWENYFLNYTIRINDQEIKMGVDSGINVPNELFKDFIVRENVWALRYKKTNSENEEEYIKINNQDYGPYERIDSFDISDNNWGFVYEENEECLVNIKGDIFGPYEKSAYGFCSFDLLISDKHWALKYRRDNKYYLNIDNTIYGPYDTIYYDNPFAFISNNNWGFKFIRDDKYYINVNGNEYQTTQYKSIDSNNFLDNNWGFEYKDGEEKYLVLNGETYGPYESIFLELSENHYGFLCVNNEKEYININGKTYEEYSNFEILSLSNEHIAFTYRDKNEYWYIIDNQKYGPFEHPGIKVLNDHILIFTYNREEATYNVTIDDHEYGPYDYEDFDSNYNFYSSGDKWALKYKKDDKWYINTNYELGDNITPTPPPTGEIDTQLTNQLKGKLLLAVEDRGRVYYVNPEDGKKYEVTFSNALHLFQRLALGISNADLNNIPLSTDTWISAAGNRLKGKLLLQVEDRGRIWYVDMNGKRHEVTWNNLMDLFTSLALGITNDNLSKIANEDLSNTNIDTDNDGLIDSDEAVYGTDINNPDSDGDGYLDGEEVEHGYDPLQGGGAKLLNCAKEGELCSTVYKDKYPENCCGNLKEKRLGGGSISIGNGCYSTGMATGNPVNICINCGNSICEDIEDVCNCPNDCDANNSDYVTTKDFCEYYVDLNTSLTNMCKKGEYDFPICSLCEWN